MKFYKDNDNQIYAYESDGSQDKWIKEGLVQISEKEADEITNPKTPVTLDILMSPYVSAAQSRLDTFARTKQYDNIHTAAIYANEASLDPFKSDGYYCVRMMNETWLAGYGILNTMLEKYKDGLPSLEKLLEDFPVSDFIKQLPELIWPGDIKK